jgi:hypothetical protein
MPMRSCLLEADLHRILLRFDGEPSFSSGEIFQQTERGFSQVEQKRAEGRPHGFFVRLPSFTA